MSGSSKREGRAAQAADAAVESVGALNEGAARGAFGADGREAAGHAADAVAETHEMQEADDGAAGEPASTARKGRGGRLGHADRDVKRRPAGLVTQKPMVALVGRPNVGKSSLFNRLAGARIAITEDIPGVTRDRHYADAEAYGHAYMLVDTGGFDPDSTDPVFVQVSQQVELAVSEADVVVVVFDATAEPTEADKHMAALLRRTDRPVLFVSNKADSPHKGMLGTSYYALGVERLFPVSALHGHGVGELEEAIVRTFLAHPPKQVVEQEAWADLPRIAIIGKPNAGKSSLVNHLVGEARHLVDERPGTTVDSVDSLAHYGGQSYVLIDTAGMRRKRAVEKRTVEGLAVLQGIRAIERAEVVVLMIDAHEGPSEQDAKIAGLVEVRGRGLVIGLNKSDLMDAETRKKALQRADEILAFAPWADIHLVSVKKGQGIDKLLKSANHARAERSKRVGTGEINRFFAEVIETHPPPTSGSKTVRLYYATQAETEPPLFVVVTNEPKGVHFSYQRYVVNQLRKRFGFDGTPIRVRYRGKANRRPYRSR